MIFLLWQEKWRCSTKVSHAFYSTRINLSDIFPLNYLTRILFSYIKKLNHFNSSLPLKNNHAFFTTICFSFVTIRNILYNEIKPKLYQKKSRSSLPKSLILENFHLIMKGYENDVAKFFQKSFNSSPALKTSEQDFELVRNAIKLSTLCGQIQTKELPSYIAKIRILIY